MSFPRSWRAIQLLSTGGAIVSAKSPEHDHKKAGRFRPAFVKDDFRSAYLSSFTLAMISSETLLGQAA